MTHMDAVDMAEGRDRSPLGKSVRVVVILLAAIGGAVAGFALTLAILVLRARSGHYIFAMHDLVALRLDTLPIAIFMVVGFIMGVLHPRGLDRAIGWGLLAMLGGILIGAPAGRLVWGPGEGTWSGAVILGALGLLCGGIVSFRRRTRPQPRLYAGAIGTVGIIILALSGAMGATHLIESRPLDFDPSNNRLLPDAAEIDAVVFLLGDAGATERGRSPLLDALERDIEMWSGALARDSAVSIVFLGDNVYPVGVRDRTHPAFATDSARLWNLIHLVGGESSMRHGTLGLFLPGNHDWGNTAGDGGYERIRNQAEQIDAARTAGFHVALVPAIGSPGPDVRDLRRNVRLLFLDTHWFLQARPGTEQQAFFDSLESRLLGAGDREVILLSHHPYRSAGPHGAILPGNHVGGVSYLLKKSGALVQDLNSPVYSELLSGARDVFEKTGRPPLVFAGGHDHSLQVLRGESDFDPRFALVSGAGSKVSTVEMASDLLWGGQQPGWMMLVFRKDDGVDLFVIAGDRARVHCDGNGADLAECMNIGTNAFDVVFSAPLLDPSKRPFRSDDENTELAGTPWWTEEGEVSLRDLPDDDDERVVPPPVAVPARSISWTTDSVTTTPGRRYPAGRLHRVFAGNLNRHLWSVPIRLPVLNLDSVGGGLRPVEMIGGMQTVGLRFQGRDGHGYEFRSIVKDARRTLPGWLQNGLLQDAVNDQMAAQFPLAAVAVAALLEAAGIVAPEPIAVVLPNDPRLGDYRALFAGRVGLFAPHASERADGRPGFGGYAEILDDDEFEEVLATDNTVEFDAPYYLRIRLIDMLIGDWDRHEGQWSWARVNDDRGPVYRPIPEDRDWAFARLDGFLPFVIAMFMSRYVGFDKTFPPVDRLTEAGRELDQRILSQLKRTDFTSIADQVQAVITDSVINAAIAKLPAPYRDLEHDRLASALRARRHALDTLATDLYSHLTTHLHIFGTDGAVDRVTFETVSNGVRIVLESDGVRRFERVVDRTTRRVTLHIDDGEDVLIRTARLPFEISF